MCLPQVVSRADWLVARKELLDTEKMGTRAGDALSAARRRLPMVRVEKAYVVEGPEGPARLLDLFEGRRQLIVRHLVFDARLQERCPGADDVSPGVVAHLHARDTTLALVSRAPLDRLERHRAGRGWGPPCYSSHGGDFTFDLQEGMLDEAAGGAAVERPGLSCFLRDADSVFHTYSTYGRGLEALGGAYAYLDLTALGRQEAWEEPRGRAPAIHAALPGFPA
jgi:predicted dithiol-disulfide oxidoreductase (DUF899 family)